MPELTFHIRGIEPAFYSATPLLILKVGLSSSEAHTTIQSVLLQCQIQIQPSRRAYQPAEQKQLRDLFGDPEGWGRTLRPLLWTNASVTVPSFTGETVAEVPVPCTFDFNVAATKYFHGLQNGDIPICALFSGTVFYPNKQGALQIEKISWNSEANYRVPVQTWKQMMERHYPNVAWLCLRRDIFDRLHEFKVSRGIPTWEQTMENILLLAQEGNSCFPRVRVRS